MRSKNVEEINLNEVKIYTNSQLKIIGQRIKELRVERGWTQFDLCVACYLEKCTISAIERGMIHNITLLTLFKISTAFKIDVWELINPKV